MKNSRRERREETNNYFNKAISLKTNMFKKI